MGCEGGAYWEQQLSEYWDSGLTIQEYSELKELPYESTRRCSEKEVRADLEAFPCCLRRVLYREGQACYA